MYQTSKQDKNVSSAVAEPCKAFPIYHTEDLVLLSRIDIIYKIYGLNDTELAKRVGIARSTMNRYKRGVWLPDNNMKLKIAQAIGVDSAIIWGESLIFEKWKEEQRYVR